jgi:UDP-glucose 4-epimerase
MAEELCVEYIKLYGIKISIISFFSIYGIGLKKQIFWDACNKLYKNDFKAEFFGTGDEIRDFLYIEDAVDLIYRTSFAEDPPFLLNGGTGTGLMIKQVLSRVKEKICSNAAIVFNNNGSTYDPKYYIADNSEAISLGWKPNYSIEKGLDNYITWYLTEKQ